MFKRNKKQDDKEILKRVEALEIQVKQITCKHKNLSFKTNWVISSPDCYTYYKVCDDCDKILEDYDIQTDWEEAKER